MRSLLISLKSANEVNRSDLITLLKLLTLACSGKWGEQSHTIHNYFCSSDQFFIQITSELTRASLTGKMALRKKSTTRNLQTCNTTVPWLPTVDLWGCSYGYIRCCTECLRSLGMCAPLFWDACMLLEMHVLPWDACCTCPSSLPMLKNQIWLY